MSGRVVWITGLSGAGKSTVSAHLRPHLLRADPKTIFLDGDDLRAVMAAASVDGADHGRAQRLELAQRYARLCRLLALQNFTVVIATISLFREVHEWNRNNLPGYVEVYLKVPVEELRRRDPKGLYRRHLAGDTRNVAGLDFSIDEPDAADLVFDWVPGSTAETIAADILHHLQREMIRT
ncbi:adenylyl-sulfate kinase [Rhizobium sp. SG2393]|uniref:adenylyl-sulfate kinase n=1 Tax=Rhizobium sp. SG2393 TaxID=3276279 RepID=UPI00366A6081